MPTYELLSLRQQIQRTAQTLIQRNAISPAHFANISARVPGEPALLLTSAATLSELTLDDLAVVGFDGTVRAGRLPGGTYEIIQMHARVYAHRPDVGGIIHTHSPYATAFAVATRVSRSGDLDFALSGLLGATSHHTWSRRSRFKAPRLTCRCAACAGLNEPPSSPMRMFGAAIGTLRCSAGRELRFLLTRRHLLLHVWGSSRPDLA